MDLQLAGAAESMDVDSKTIRGIRNHQNVVFHVLLTVARSFSLSFGSMTRTPAGEREFDGGMREILCIQHGTAFHFLSFDQVIVRKRSKSPPVPTWTRKYPRPDDAGPFCACTNGPQKGHRN
jgi:hypothetical protein